VELDWLVMAMSCRTSRRLIRTVGGLTVAMALLSFAGCDEHPAVEASAAPASSSSVPATPVAPAPASPSLMVEPKAFTTTGPLVAERQADVAVERDGRVAEVAAQIGDRVRSGQLLALLDDRALRAAVDSQKAKVASLEAQVGEWESEQKTEEADLRRMEIMLKDNIRSQEDWEHVKYKLDETVQEVARYRADKVGAEADLRSASLQLEQSRVIAPFDGVVGRSSVRQAQEVKKGDVLFWITAEGPLRVLFTVPETAMAAFPAGASLELTTADYPNLRQPARILRVSPVVDPASGSVQVIAAVVQPSPLLRPGMSMQVRLAP
jgi:membrane fusion protein (multidrug efflux system)